MKNPETINSNIKKVAISYKKNKGISVTIELKNLSEQNFYHLENAISSHLEGQRALIGHQSKESIKKYGDNKESFQYLVGYMEPLRDKLRKEFPLKKDWETK